MKRNHFSSKLIGCINAGNLCGAKEAALYEDITPSTQFTLEAMAPHVPYVCEVIRVILQRGGFTGSTAKLIQYVEQYEAEVVLSRNWNKILVLINDAPLQMSALMAMVAYLKTDIDNKKVAEVFRCYQEKYDFNKVMWPEEHKELFQNLVAEIAIKLS
ncbi:MAG: hypothetical protein VZR95_07915 [Alphaproteobacteria bacterium]